MSVACGHDYSLSCHLVAPRPTKFVSKKPVAWAAERTFKEGFGYWGTRCNNLTFCMVTCPSHDNHY